MWWPRPTWSASTRPSERSARRVLRAHAEATPLEALAHQRTVASGLGTGAVSCAALADRDLALVAIGSGDLGGGVGAAADVVLAPDRAARADQATRGAVGIEADHRRARPAGPVGLGGRPGHAGQKGRGADGGEQEGGVHRR